MSAPRLALVSCASPMDPSGWSGTPYHLLRELQRRFADVTVIDTPALDGLIARGSGLARVGILPAREPIVSDLYTRWLTRRLGRLKPDVVVAVAAEAKVAGLARDWPLVVVSDSFFGNMVGYYEKYAGLSRRTLSHGDDQQRRILNGGASVLLSSDWAARTAAEHYGVPRARFQVAPFGANLDGDPPPTLPRSNTGPLKLLFVGYDWARKGGPMTLSVLRILRRRLGAVELHIVGCDPPDVRGVEGVVRHGVLRKSVQAERAHMASLFRQSSFLLMPSRQEAYGLVYAEACAFGLPPAALATGGVGSIIHRGVNGLLLSPEATADELAAAVMRVWADQGVYLAMQRAARRAFRTRLNWRSWGDRAEIVIRDAGRRKWAGDTLAQPASRALRGSAG